MQASTSESDNMHPSKTMKQILTNRVTRWPVAVALALMACTVSSQAAEPDNGDLDIVRVRPNFYMIAGAGGNIGVQIGSDGVVLVNAGAENASGRVLAAIRKVTDLPIRYVIDTNADADFVGGNGKLAKAGKTIFTNVLGNPALADAMTNGGAAAILAHNSILDKMSAPTGKTSPFPDDALPTERNRRP